MTEFMDSAARLVAAIAALIAAAAALTNARKRK